ncbi:hypothetical protein LG302_15050 [Halomonas organivorans]
MLTTTTRAAALAAMLALPAGALADAERLEADLRARFAGTPGEFTLGEVSDSLLGGRTTAEDLSFVEPGGERVSVARYVVEGDYDAPDAVILEALSVETRGEDAGRITAERVRVAEPEGPLLWGEGRSLEEAFVAAELTIDGLAMEGEGGGIASADGKKVQPAPAASRGRVTVEHLQAVDLSRRAVGRLEMSGIAGEAEGVEDIGAGRFSLAALRIEGLRQLDGEGEDATLDRLEMNDLSIEADRLVAELASLSVDGDMTDGEGGLRLESLELDLARMIEMAPPAERTQLRMASNVLTGGSGRLTLDAAFDGSWEALGAKALLAGESRISAGDAFRWDLDVELPVRLPDGVEPSTYLARMDDLEGVTLLGGEIETTLTDLGLFGRMPAVMAASRGIGEAQFLEQARTQAKGFGTMLGPEFGAILDGLVDMMEGQASELMVHLTLPAESGVDSLAADPLALPSKLSMRVETR